MMRAVGLVRHEEIDVGDGEPGLGERCARGLRHHLDGLREDGLAVRDGHQRVHDCGVGAQTAGGCRPLRS